MWIARVAALLLLTLPLAACGDVGDGASGTGGDGDAGGTLTVFAAASLTETFTELGETFEKGRPGVRVRFNFGGSSSLARQITEGAPADVFASASPATMKPVTDAGDATGRPRMFAANRLVIAVPRDNPGKIHAVRDLSRPGRKVVLCAAPVPCGAAARTALGVAGVDVEPVSLEQDVKAVVTKVGLGEADAGLVYRTDIAAASGKVTGIEFPEAARAVSEYPIVEVADAPRPALAREFIGLVLSPAGRAVLSRAGFEAP
ncbi:molybdate transport system substrate-binding protein [Actinomadura pelletieri DSM 43383]|uniref:Molybdate transport system substrate-binding protein n=1 Tax=Actinomadura pelletieri DSM 43383 TaxID=1120940 RepID=A0A495QN66_9ACTN|nr:molybdate ABC transporter substrate-binding protein [Actinomadura pelletieri]RKS74391.1 molybdate transport system substrate-binding protein [Actinomadura pelletieri DSM 43383]